MKYKLAVFDMDGTVLDTLEDLTDAVNYALLKLDMPKRRVEEIKTFVGNGIPKLIERSLPDGFTEQNFKKAYYYFTDYYKYHCKDKTKAYDGVLETIDKLKSLGVKTCVVSNKDDYAARELAELYFPKRFDFVLGRVDGVNKKPAPDMVNIALNYFKVEKSEAVYIGDSDVDYLTAENSSLDFIGVDWGFKGYDFLIKLGAKTVVRYPYEIVNIIAE